MTYKLVIAEKPSVAQSIAKIIGATKRNDGYMEGNGYIVSWCFGHLIELAQPGDYDEKFGKWRKEDLPIFPDPFMYLVTPDTKKQFTVLKGLMDREDVESLVEATDAGREGELIFRLVYDKAGCRKKFERLWISSMEDKAIEDGFRNLRPSAEYDDLYEAALCRERADWIVGINATRLFSTLYGQTLNVGRVMTPTLAMLVSRESEIDGFRAEPFYTVQIRAGGVSASGERESYRAEAEQLLENVKTSGRATVMKMEQQKKSEKAPLPYDLTTLQRDANKCYGFTAQQTLDYTQSLYEKKLVTYPRTDSRYLTDEMDDSTSALACEIKEKFGYHGILQIHTDQIRNSNKVSDHHAIIPTENVYDTEYGELPSGEQKILGLISARLLASLGSPCETTVYDLELECAGHIFKTSENVITDPGWRDVQDWVLGANGRSAGDGKPDGDGREEADEDGEADIAGSEAGADRNSRLTEIIKADPDFFAPGRIIPVTDQSIKEGKTAPKKHFTENTLLGSMERAGADETPDEAERKGLGTPATRAGIIEKLVHTGLIERKGDRKTKNLIPTHKGIALITVMPEEIQSPVMTAEWEQKLLEIEKRTMEQKIFMSEIEEMVRDLVSTYEVVKDANVLMHPACEPTGRCPVCGSNVVEKQKGYFCSNRDCRFALWKENRFFDSIGKKMTKQMAESLIRDGKVILRKCTSRKTGKTFDTTLVMTTDEKGKTCFNMTFPNNKAKHK